MALHIQTARKPTALARKVICLERLGKYEQAMGELAGVWPDIEQPPDTEGLAPLAAAEIILRCGSLIGFYGHVAQIPNAQLRSKDLLTNAREQFLDLDNIEKAAECENYLALALWRTGEYVDAEVWVESALSRPLPISSHTRLYSFIAKSILDIAKSTLDETCKRNEENIENLRPLESEFRNCGDAFLTGSFYTNLALSLKRVGKKSEAVDHFELARFYHKSSGHKIYLGTVENNLANLYKDLGKFELSHESIDNATRIFRQVKDKTREGFSLDTKALIFFAESKYAEALKTVEKACAMLDKSENFGYFVETLLTKAKILLFLDRFSDAVLSLVDAVSIARVKTGESAAKELINEFESALLTKNAAKDLMSEFKSTLALPIRHAPPKKNLEETDLELVLPPKIAKFKGYSGVWINNPHLEEIGLPIGSLAIVARTKFQLGDLVAVSELEGGDVSCGFYDYDSDFSLVCLEGYDGEAQIFNESEVRVLGQIVGVCTSEKNAEGKMVVEALKI